MKDKRTYQDRKEYLRKYQREYYHNNPKQKESCLKRNKTKEFKKYQKGWVNNNKEKVIKIDKKFSKSNKRKEYLKVYRKTDVGKTNMIKGLEKRRKKNLIRASKKWDYPTIKLIKFVRDRDKKCIYCNCKFNYSNAHHPKYPTYDHLNPNLSLNKNNAVLCCLSCNSSKKDKDVLEWLKIKNYSPSKVIIKLLNKQNEN